MLGLKIERLSLTPEGVDRILQTAIDAGHVYGFGYWGQVMKAERHPETKLLRAIELREHDPDPERTIVARRIGVRSLRAGILKMLQEDRDGQRCGRIFDDEFLDGPLAELLIQYAMFGEQVYG